MKKTNTRTVRVSIPKWAKITIIVVATVVVVAFFAVGWLVSSRILQVSTQSIAYDQTILAIDGDSYTIGGGAYNIMGVAGGVRDGSLASMLFSAPASLDDAAETSVRTLAILPNPELKVGDKLSLQGNVWTSDPQEALGIPFQNVTYTSPAGNMNAWLVPGSSTTKWVIGVHGIGADKTEMLRFVRPVHDAGNTMFVINYRNDVGNPKSPDGRTHLGDTEWQDVEAAVRYAIDNGATDIRLYGDSLGGSLVQNYLRRTTDDKSVISRVILDSPALNWKEILRHQLQKGGYPSAMYYPGAVMLKLRAGVSVKNISTKPESIDKKTLIIHSSDDPTVPQGASKAIADARPDLVTLVDFKQGGHLRSWNNDQFRYEQLVFDFLSD